jgi:hypothetical protein
MACGTLRKTQTAIRSTEGIVDFAKLEERLSLTIDA